MNTNIDNIFKDLKKELSKDVYQELDLNIYDCNGKDYFKMTNFKKKYLEICL